MSKSSATTWYRTYRPATIAGLHLTTVRQTFEQLLKKGHLPQVLLFAGAKGTGKTSTARILAAIVNVPANAESINQTFLAGGTSDKSANSAASKSAASALLEPNLDNELVRRIQAGVSLSVQELDAASHRGIDDIRQLKERVNLPPAEGLISVYILDEVHMLTTEAFNALLKLLEEPPRHVLFILATTELHKVPATVVSRCTVVEFAKAQPNEIAAALKSIIDAEGVRYDEATLQAIATQADGSFRDAVKQAQQLAHRYGALTVDLVDQELQLNLSAEVRQLVSAVINKDPVAVTEVFRAWRAHGVPTKAVEQAVCAELHQALLQDIGAAPGQAFISAKIAHFLLTELSQVMPEPITPISLLPLELRALDVVFRAQAKKSGGGSDKNGSDKGGSDRNGSDINQSDSAGGAEAASITAKKAISSASRESEDETNLIVDMTNSIVVETVVPVAHEAIRASDNLDMPDPVLSARLLENWQQFIAGVKTRNTSLAAILGSAKPSVGAQGQACIEVYYRFHQEQLQQPKFFQMLQDAMAEVVGSVVGVEFVVANAPAAATAGESPADTVSNQQFVSLAAQALI